MTARRLEVEIGRLVMPGLDRRSARLLESGLRAELERLLADREICGGLPAVADGTRIGEARLDMPAGTGPAGAGASIARAIVAGIGR